MNKKSWALLGGLFLFFWAIYLLNIYLFVIAGTLLILGAGALFISNSWEAKQRLRRCNSSDGEIPKTTNREFAEAREIEFAQSIRGKEVLNDEVLARDAELNLGWGQEEEEIKEDWWRHLPPIECGCCGACFKIVEGDIGNIKFPSEQNEEKGYYLEISCKGCQRRITVFKG